MVSGALGFWPLMLVPLFGYFFCMITMLTAVVVLLSSFSNISTVGIGRHHLRPPVIGRTVMVEIQRHSPVAKEETPAKDASPVVATAKADAKKIKHYKPRVLASQRNNDGYGGALGYVEESRSGPRGPFFQ
jgi:hypothetical protein